MGFPSRVLALLGLCAAVSSSTLPERLEGTSAYRMINRVPLMQCVAPNPYLAINVSTTGPLPGEAFLNVTVGGLITPDPFNWVAMLTPSNSSLYAYPITDVNYGQTGDIDDLPLLSQYPIKAQFLTSDPNYVDCKNTTCQRRRASGECEVQTCGATITFHIINIRSDIQFVLFSGGFQAPCVLTRSAVLKFANPAMPLHGHLCSIDSQATSMKLTWVSGDPAPQRVRYARGKSATSAATTFTQEDMCSVPLLPSPAKDFGWHNPGYIHSAIMTGLQPSQFYHYRYGSPSVGWSDKVKFKTPPASGSNELSFVIYGDMGKAPLDLSVEHYIQPGSLSVARAVAKEVQTGNIDSIFHLGDISYATGFLVEWDFFLNQIEPIASHVSYMTAIGNHERAYSGSGSLYQTPDSGGECGVPYETYFPMPAAGKDKPWYSIEQGSVHFLVMSSEHQWSKNSEQYNWIVKDFSSIDRSRTPWVIFIGFKDFSSIDRSRTPWVIFIGHRPMYSTDVSIPTAIDPNFVSTIEPLLFKNKVDLAFSGHVHNYERTCAVYQGMCKGTPMKDANGIDIYESNNYTAPVHAIVGAAGFHLAGFPSTWPNWSLSRFSEFGYAKVHATKTDILVQFVNSSTMQVRDQFRIVK